MNVLSCSQNKTLSKLFDLFTSKITFSDEKISTNDFFFFPIIFILSNLCRGAFDKHRKQKPGLIQRKHAQTEAGLLRGHVEPCRGIPHTHPATVTCDSQRSSTGQQIKTQQQPFLHQCGEWNRNAGRRESGEKGSDWFVISFGDGFTLILYSSLPFSFTSSVLHPPLLSKAVTPARCTSLTPHAAFLSSPEKSLVK